MDAILPAAGIKARNTLISLPRAMLERSGVSDQMAAQTTDMDDQRLQDCAAALVVCITVGPQEVVFQPSNLPLIRPTPTDSCHFQKCGFSSLFY